jgi:glycosyltransferase involved in cell wall biosynthesis
VAGVGICSIPSTWVSGSRARDEMTDAMQPAPPLISVVMGVYNAASYLSEALDSVLAQSYQPFEIVVVDDGSNDGSAEILRGYGETIVYARQENRGDGAARNTAVGLATGEILAFLDADDLCVNERLELQSAAFSSDPDLDIVFGHILEFVSPELSAQEAATLRPPWRGPMPWRGVMPMAIKRESFARVGPFSETLRVGSPVDWCARALDLGLKTTMLPEVLVKRRLHLSSLTVREQASRPQYIDVVKSALQRRRAVEGRM